MKTVIVTGAAGNLGKAVVQKFLDEGSRVIGIDKQDAGIAHPHFKMVSLNLSNEKDVEEFVAQVIREFETIDVAILTAGGFAIGDIAETNWQNVWQQIELNFQTAYNLARPSFIQMMKKGEGRIFLIGSRPGSDMKYSKGMTAYGFSKSLIFRLAELMNEEAKGTHVVASVIVPSTIDTPQNRKSMPNADPSKWVRAEEIAGIIYFYCTEAASPIRETVIKVYKNA